MGQSSSSEIAKNCKYNKVRFNTLLDIIRDAHKVTLFYASIIIQDKMPLRLSEYVNYTEDTEEYFNQTRKNTREEIKSIIDGNPISYYQYYQYLTTLQSRYENINMEETERRQLIQKVFENCYSIQKLLIDDLWQTCNSQ